MLLKQKADYPKNLAYLCAFIRFFIEPLNLKFIIKLFIILRFVKVRLGSKQPITKQKSCVFLWNPIH
jgi:hypothetical protein